ncbi:hypothetical protein BO82DRAFT_435301 [Aspergillus uvarum CBS 121591]|uniref:Uncharacterized protein n=1 Tax=Aspergillus uvarum CBS 121591 TaxID=1448315 RepID=A0A319C2L6_9EURO|nr:hypothetical protein BO82DRAFT_435301 [Aspergillus uvarum CBS 121591]PYH78039.1 hypothetical protein BO82DRAFT_435301 [Aspergillus uvarum CBS 121591]
MTEITLSPEEIWSGGIPTTVRLHPGIDLDDDDLLEEIKGWCLFVKESRAQIPNLDKDVTNRRGLIQKWASADQSFRDSYHQRAPLPATDVWDTLRQSPPFICLVDQPYTPENYVRITKLLILLYIHLGRDCGHPFSHHGVWYPTSQLPGFLLDPATSASAVSPEDRARLLTPANIPTSSWLEPADLGMIALTRAGTVVFPNLSCQAFYILDDQSCYDGRLLLLHFAPNGQVAHQARMLPWNLGPLTSFRYSLWHSWAELMEDSPYTHPRWNRPIDMHLPLLDIMASLTAREDLEQFNDASQEEWAEEFERFAPEFLAYERQNREREYSWDRLAEIAGDGPLTQYNHLRHVQKLAALQGRCPPWPAGPRTL